MRTAIEIEVSERLRKRLFRRDAADFDDGKSEHVTYHVLFNCMDDALATWAIHGICLHCQQWSITDGRCCECGRVYREGRRDAPENLKLFAAQFERAKELV